MGRNWAKHDTERDRCMSTMIDAALPEDIHDWIQNEVLDDQQYIIYDRKSKFAYCTRCEKCIDQKYLTTIWSEHNAEATCPECGKKATFKCWGKYRKTAMLQNAFQFRLMNRTTEGVVVRLFEVNRVISKNSRLILPKEVKVSFYFDELQRVFNNGTVTRRYRSYDSYHNQGTYWQESTAANFSSIGSPYGYVRTVPEYEYRKNIPEVVSGTWLQYAKLNRPVSLEEYGAWIKPVEYMIKMGLKSLAKDVLYHQTAGLKLQANSVHELLDIPKNHVKHVIELNTSKYDLDLYRKLLKSGITWPTAEDLSNGHRYGYDWNQARKVVKISLRDFVKAINGSSNKSASAMLYKDYLGFCQKLGYDMTEKSVLFPADINEAHNREMARLKIKENEDLNNRILARFEKDQKRFSVSADFVIRPPKDMDELLAEGSKLQHCVGTYAERVAKNETTILLIRKSDQPDEPYFTVEWREGQLIQCRGKRNCDPPDEVNKFIDEWKRIKKLNKSKNNRRILA